MAMISLNFIFSHALLAWVASRILFSHQSRGPKRLSWDCVHVLIRLSLSETKTNKTKSDQSRPKQTKPNQIKSNHGEL